MNDEYLAFMLNKNLEKKHLEELLKEIVHRIIELEKKLQGLIE